MTTEGKLRHDPHSGAFPEVCAPRHANRVTPGKPSRLRFPLYLIQFFGVLTLEAGHGIFVLYPSCCILLRQIEVSVFVNLGDLLVIRCSILLKGMLCTTLSVFSVAVCLAPLSTGDILKIREEQKLVKQLALAASADLVVPGFEKVSFEAVKHYSAMYGVDYRLILAIIKQESRFDHQALSERGAKGYMQIMPVTNSEIREELELSEPELPLENIRAGVYYFSKLYSLFPGASESDRLSLALAAYNAGPARIYDAQELAAYIGEDAHSWSSVESILPLLSKRYYSLHETVWEAGHPPSGYFGESHQTIGYVRNVLKSYAFYRSVM
jgi:hypothetical protein